MDPRDVSTAAELHVIVDTVERQRDRVRGLATSYLGSGREDVITLIHEAERQLHIAVRALHRATRSIESAAGP